LDTKKRGWRALSRPTPFENNALSLTSSDRRQIVHQLLNLRLDLRRHFGQLQFFRRRLRSGSERIRKHLLSRSS
jgi:hypothetical protein